MEISIKWNLCRVCLKDNHSELVSLFNDAKLADQIQKCTNKTVHEDDGMPNQICYDCFDELQTAYDFILKFNQSDEHIRAVVKRTMSTTSSLTNFTTSSGECRDSLASGDSHAIGKSLLRSEFKRKLTKSALNAPATKMPKLNFNMRNIEMSCNSEKEIFKNVQSVNENCGPITIETSHARSPKSDEAEEDIYINDIMEDKNTKSFDEAQYDSDDHGDQYIDTASIESQEDTTNSSNDYIIIVSDKEHPQYARTISEDGLLEESIMHTIKEETDEEYHMQAIEQLIEEDNCLPLENNCNVNFKIIQQVECHDPSQLTQNKPLEHKKQVEVKHVCPTCKNSFPRLSLLKSHMVIHQKVKKFQCELCLKKFGSSHNLANHMRTHTGEKPYECTYCERRFGDRSSHLKHERIHTDERPFTCLTCGKSFALSTTLKAHEATHSDEKPYSCEICKKGFKLKHQLKAHLSTTAHKLAKDEIAGF